MIFTSLSLPLILAATIASIILRLYRAVYRGRQRKALMRSNGSLPPPWNIHAVLPLAHLRSLISQLKAAAQSRLFGSITHTVLSDGRSTAKAFAFQRRVIYTIDPENIKAMLLTEHLSWSYSTAQSRGLEMCVGRGIFSANGADWKQCRQAILPSFKSARVNKVERLERHVSGLISHIPPDGTTVDLSALFYRLTLDSMTEFFFGEGTCALASIDERHPLGESVGLVLFYVLGGITAPLLVRHLLLLLEQSNMRPIHAFVDQYVHDALARRQELLGQRSKSSSRYSLVEELARESNDAERIRSQLIHVLFASRETTGSLLTNMWFFLARRPDVWQKLQAEVASLGGQQPSHKQVEGLKYLRAVIDEVLRLHPPVPYQEKMATKDTTLPRGGGPDGSAPMFVKEGEIVAWMLDAMHRRRDFYGDDAEHFRPERWLDDEATGAKGLRPGWEYLPWNGGAHSCLGQQLGFMTAAYVTVRLCQTYDRIESRVDGRWKESLNGITRNLNGGKVGLFAREQVAEEQQQQKDGGDESSGR
ncbi:hypothetical protein CP532_3523 [Ophiocordyceps camponoti-leonardi (nom. inval.)]|nr:hypothetical protein CP532_3523 [Ophiocordyceps camponoti-leonardi (nom. inval.)]